MLASSLIAGVLAILDTLAIVPSIMSGICYLVLYSYVSIIVQKELLLPETKHKNSYLKLLPSFVFWNVMIIFATFVPSSIIFFLSFIFLFFPPFMLISIVIVVAVSFVFALSHICLELPKIIHKEFSNHHYQNRGKRPDYLRNGAHILGGPIICYVPIFWALSRTGSFDGSASEGIEFAGAIIFVLFLLTIQTYIVILMNWIVTDNFKNRYLAHDKHT